MLARRLPALILLLVACAHTSSPGPAKVVMHKYYLVLLHRGPAWTPVQTPATQKLFEGHMANIQKMADAKKLVIAGPVETPPEDRTGLAGVFVFDVASVDEVNALLTGDPAIEAKRLIPEIHEWWSAQGLGYDK